MMLSVYNFLLSFFYEGDDRQTEASNGEHKSQSDLKGSSHGNLSVITVDSDADGDGVEGEEVESPRLKMMKAAGQAVVVSSQRPFHPSYNRDSNMVTVSPHVTSVAGSNTVGSNTGTVFLQIPVFEGSRKSRRRRPEQLNNHKYGGSDKSNRRRHRNNATSTTQAYVIKQPQ